MLQEKEPDEEFIKEVYAWFGLAYYHSECLHRELCNIYALSNFRNNSEMTTPRVEEKLAYAYKLTLGQIRDELKNIIPNDLFLKLNDGVEKRNYLAHHFWFEKIHLMVNSAGLEEMINYLKNFSALFKELDKNAMEYFEPIRNHLGITEELIQEELTKIKSGNAGPLKPLPKKRKLKKQERIVHVWELSLPNNRNKGLPIFETEDGCLWQLCEAGLGWTYHDVTEPEWQENKIIKKYLPANINPRPIDYKPWNYQFKLKNNMIFYVNSQTENGIIKWGLKST